MGFLRRLLGSPGTGADRPTGAGSDHDADPPGGPPAPDRDRSTSRPDPGRIETDEGGDPRLQDDPGRARALVSAFDAGLDDLAMRQLRYAELAWRPPSQLRRDGDWILMDRWEGRSPDGRAVTLKAGERLTYAGEGSAWPGSTRFTTAKGEPVDLPPGGGDDGWPDDLQRPRSATAGSDDG